MTELSREEEYLLEKWRGLPDWAVIEVRKSNGKLFEIEVRTLDRFSSKSELFANKT